MQDGNTLPPKVIPKDEETRYNLAVAQRKLKQNPPPKNKPKNKDKKQPKNNIFLCLKIFEKKSMVIEFI
jgi:hypothetical protein